MIRLYIVDDESSVRKGLTECIDWNKYDIKIVGTGNNGKTACEEIKVLQPDIVITDIKMPFMDGIELANYLHFQMPEIEIIFLSGYDDVEYLKEAIKIEAIDYILKPFTIEELDLVLRKAQQKIIDRETKKKLLAEMQEKIVKSFPLLKEKCITELLLEDNTEENLQNRLDFLDIRLPIHTNYCVLIISIDNKEIVYERMTEKEKQVYALVINDAITSVVWEDDKGYALSLNAGITAIILSLNEEDGDYLLTVANKLRESIGNSIPCDFTIGIGCMVESLTQLRESYLTACEAAVHKMYFGKNKIIVFDALSMKYQEDTRHLTLFNEEKFNNILRMGYEERATEYIEAIFDQLQSNQCSIHNVRILSMQIALSTLKYIIEIGLRDAERMKVSEWMDKIQKLETVEDIKIYLRSFIVEICIGTNKKRDAEGKKITNRIKTIITTRYSENLTISDIADEIFLTATYLCLIFKQETGITINEYITKTRIEEAIRLLKDPANKLYQVCESVGYSDPSYFSRLFKKHTGLTPSDYREQIEIE